VIPGRCRRHRRASWPVAASSSPEALNQACERVFGTEAAGLGEHGHAVGLAADDDSERNTFDVGAHDADGGRSEPAQSGTGTVATDQPEKIPVSAIKTFDEPPRLRPRAPTDGMSGNTCCNLSIGVATEDSATSPEQGYAPSTRETRKDCFRRATSQTSAIVSARPAEPTGMGGADPFHGAGEIGQVLVPPRVDGKDACDVCASLTETCSIRGSVWPNQWSSPRPIAEAMASARRAAADKQAFRHVRPRADTPDRPRPAWMSAPRSEPGN
jgi:hypothetical protein